MPTLFIDLLIKPRKRFTIKTDQQEALVQSLVLYVQNQYSSQSDWSLYKYGKSFGCLCSVDAVQFINWLENLEYNNRIDEILKITKPYLRIKENIPQLTVYIPLNWYCIALNPVRDQVRKLWLSSATSTALTETSPILSVPTLLPFDYYILCEGRAIPNSWQHHFEKCLRIGIPFIVLWHYRPKQKSYSHRYDILFSWEPFINSHPHIFYNKKYPDIEKVITRRISQMIKNYNKKKGFEKSMLQGGIVNGQVSILKLNFEAAQQLMFELVNMLQRLIIDMEEKIEIGDKLNEKKAY
ncbi:hypothetical protein Xmau_03821 [Xenorhabdus mauleonii]|uniref:Uncharacterized protein n=1 Tax=Xenorhabdus mauleonii TaxID=351675 RepID=A0A1I3V1H8_9GAMM|nr:hypothetical protein [Xenorhabdus mauleonii]PHM37604.1 hypothetical protein Xmau_03821 [Xenorhabdus mauleonii]SFJ89524.1 hypothetical protein SAMN05421680_11926 [Xenorhabdus mauleonii]